MTRVVHILLGGLSFACAACPPATPPDVPYQPTKTICGNDRKQSGETCDRSDLADMTCGQLGYGSGVLGCKASCKDFDRSGCSAPSTCSDGVRNGVEICDGTDLAGAICETLGLGPGTLRCLPNCGDYDIAGCAPPPDCGDDEINGPAELCDGEDLDHLTCARLGYESGTLRCASDCLSFDRSGCMAPRDAAVADSTVADGFRPDAAGHDLGVPDVRIPDVRQPDTRIPDVSVFTDHALPDLVATPDSALAMDAWHPPDAGAAVLSVYDIQNTGSILHPLVETWVTVQGVIVTAIDARGNNLGFWVQEPGGGRYSGIFVYKPDTDPFDVTTLQRGDVVTVSGLYIEYFDLSELQMYSVQKTASGAAPYPEYPSDLGTDPEAWEGVLVQVGPDCVVTGFYSFGEVQTTCARLDDEISTFAVEYGMSFSSITGIWNYNFETYKLLPRDVLDFGAFTYVDAGGFDL
ncbi:MAG: hypothetical protein ABIJ09_06590 [Pseudomonadota bacterium]